MLDYYCQPFRWLYSTIQKISNNNSKGKQAKKQVVANTSSVNNSEA